MKKWRLVAIAAVCGAMPALAQTPAGNQPEIGTATINPTGIPPSQRNPLLADNGGSSARRWPQPHTADPRTIAVDKNPAYPKAVAEMKGAAELWRFSRLRQVRFLNDPSYG